MELISPGVVLVAYAEPLLEGHRVVVFGDATSSLAAELVERGARTVHVYDPEPARAAVAAGRNRSKQISVVPLDEADVAVRDGAFDVAIVEDLSTAGEPAALLKRVRRAVAQRGTAIVASPNPDAKFSLVPRTSGARASSALGYYELYDAVSAEFAEVRMLGQTPFVGYAVVDFAPDDEPEVSIDSGLVPGGAEEPEWFVALASRDPQENDSFAIVQLPASRVVTSGVDEQLASDLRAARANEARLVEETAEAKAQLTELRSARDRDAADAMNERADRLERELSKREAWIIELEARATAADTRADQAVDELDQARHKSGAVEKISAERDADKTELAKQLTALTTDKTGLTRQLAALTADKAELAKQLTALTADKAESTKQLAAVAADKAAVTKQVTALAAEKAELAKQLATTKQSLSDATAARDAEVRDLKQTLLAKDARLKELADPSALRKDDDTGKLEAALRERGDRVRTLEADLREAERVGKELVRELKVTSRAAESATGSPDSEGISAQNARLVADLAAAGWTIQELEDRVSNLSPAAR